MIPPPPSEHRCGSRLYVEGPRVRSGSDRENRTLLLIPFGPFNSVAVANDVEACRMLAELGTISNHIQ